MLTQCLVTVWTFRYFILKTKKTEVKNETGVDQAQRLFSIMGPPLDMFARCFGKIFKKLESNLRCPIDFTANTGE